MKDLTFRQVSETNLARTSAWHPGGIDDWLIVDWSNAMAGEAGEVCNAVKKLRRIDTGIVSKRSPLSRDEAIAAIRKEIGDTYLYLDLTAQKLGMEMAEIVAEVFNQVSEEEGLPFKLPMEPRS